MADCGDFSHQAIAYQGLFDLKDAQIIRAEIDVIDVANNEAAVTLLDACDFDDWLDTDAVPFFYHCEFSSGTVEDLAKGHKAFMVGDMVYIILLPGKGEEFPPQAYIVGHVDIRGTRPCAIEHILITQGVRIDGVWKKTFVLFRPSTGEIIDPRDIVSLELSPANPTIAYGEYTSAINDWFVYNFEDVTTINTIPINATTNLQCGDLPDYELSIQDMSLADIWEPYTGNTWRITSEVDACIGFSLGNSHFRRLLTETGDSFNDPPEVGTSYSMISDFECSSPEKFHYGGSELNCSFYWGSSRRSYTTESTYATNYGWSIVDNVTAQTIGIPIVATARWHEERTTYFDGEIFTGSWQKTFSSSAVFVFSQLGISNQTDAVSMSASASFSEITTPGLELSIAPTTAEGKVGQTILYQYTPRRHLPEPYTFRSAQNPQVGSGVLLGNEGVYIIFAGQAWEEYKDVSPAHCNGFVHAYPGTYIDDGPHGYNDQLTVTIDSEEKGKFSFYVSGIVTLFDDSFDTSQPISITQSIESARIGESESFSAAIRIAVDLVHTLFTEGNTNLEAEAQIFGMGSGPSFRLIKKRQTPP